MFEKLDQIPWREARTAYGRATDAPRWSRALDSPDPDERAEAVNHFLWSSAFHQYTLYSVTPFVITFVLEALTSATLAERDNGVGDPMKRELLHFLKLCAQSGQAAMSGRTHPAAPRIEDAIRTGAEVYRRYLADPDPRSRADALWLHEFSVSVPKTT